MIHTEKNLTYIKLFKSWATTENPFNSTEDILTWIGSKNNEIAVNIKKVSHDYSEGYWYYDSLKGEIRNKHGAFFQIKGLQKIKNGFVVHEQPIIIQNEIGYLGIICKEFNGILYFLMQAKIEPGNVNKIQISPTIQATKSNFMQTHGGKVPAYLDYFLNNHNYEVIIDQIQSEQSSRFFGKRNRNIIIVVNDEIEVLDSHKWMTLGQIKQLMNFDNLVNMDTRTVISCIPLSLNSFSNKELIYFHTFFKNESFYNSLFYGNPGYEVREIFHYINDVKMLDCSEIKLVDLFSLKSLIIKPNEIYTKSGLFKIVYCDIEIEGREVRKWQQPLLESISQSIFGLIYYEDNNIQKFLIHANSEVGCFDKIEIGPSVQLDSLDDNYLNPIDCLFISNFHQNKGIVFSGVFSEEGGRFYQEQNRNVIMKIDKKELPNNLPDGYFWVDFQTLNVLIQFNNCLNIQLRNLISIINL